MGNPKELLATRALGVTQGKALTRRADKNYLSRYQARPVSRNKFGGGMRALDLFSGAGGASRGLAEAGYEVVGVDIAPQRNYPFTFYQADALSFPIDGFDLIWASPPCQAFTAYKRRGPDHVRPRPNHIPAIRERLKASGVPYIIENVHGAPLINPFILCGSMFGLDIRRHRLFETNFKVPKLHCNHRAQAPRFPPATNRVNKRRTVEVGVWRIHHNVQLKAMGIDWMTLEELSEAVPPAYSEFIVREGKIK